MAPDHDHRASPQKGTEVAGIGSTTRTTTDGPEPSTPRVRSAEALMSDISRGDKEAFSDLYLLFGHRVFGLVAKVLVDREQAKEVTQDVFFQLWREAARFDRERGSAASWIFRVAHARAVDRVRLCNNSSNRDTRYAASGHLVEIDTVVERVLIRSDQSEVRSALLRLTPIQRESILLAYYGGLSTVEIAEQIGVLRATVKTRLRDGLIRLSAELTKSQAGAIGNSALALRR